MTSIRLRTSVFLIALMCCLTLVLPFCAVPGYSYISLPDPPPGVDNGDPDDIAVNTWNGGRDLGHGGLFGFGREEWTELRTEEAVNSEEVPVAANSRGYSRWLLLVYVLTGQLVVRF